MKILFICPGYYELMPYVENYIKLSEDKPDIIYWDRHGVTKAEGIIYKSKTVRSKMSLINYVFYARFIKKHLKANQYDKYIIFGIEMVFFLRKFLLTINKEYLIDIRDYHKTIRFFNIKKYMINSTAVIISSKRYLDFLPDTNNISISHNIKDIKIDNLENLTTNINYENIVIASIGGIRDEEINKKLIESLKNSRKITISYNGFSPVCDNLQKHTTNNNIENVIFTGRYLPKEESFFYKKATMINVLRYADRLNNELALPNRLYLAPFYGKPLLAKEGTYLSEVIKKYNLGLVISSFDNLEEQIISYLSKLNKKEYMKNAKTFLLMVIKENNSTNSKIRRFLNGK